MKKENFSQNMKDRMQQFEDGGLRLLKKGQKGIVHAIFSRFGLVLLLMLLQVGVLWGVFRWFGTLPVSYTHLDVYKRQAWPSVTSATSCPVPLSPPCCTGHWQA